MILRSYASLLLLAVVTSAVAQTTPAKKTTKTTARPTTTRTRATSSRSSTMQSRPAAAPVAGTRDDIGPGGNGAVGSTAAADSKGQNVYAAPGMPVNVDNPKKVEGYNGPAPTKPRSGTTLAPR